MRRYGLRDICACSAEQQIQILAIRNSDAVRGSMYTDHDIGVAEHLAYIAGLRDDDRRKVLAVLRDGQTAVGVVSLSQIDRQHRKTDWAFYLGAGERGGLGSALELFMLDHVFFEMGMEKLNCEVLETNPGVVAMHRKFGFADEGFRRSNIVRNGARIGVHLLGMTRDDWQGARAGRLAEIAARIAEIDLSADG